MITTTNLNELFQIVNVEHGEPHHVLGMHEVEHDGKKFVAVRAFVPQAKEIEVVDVALLHFYAYSFAPTISEYDRYLFGAGNHYKIFEKLGAHITTVDGVEGVSFGVWAPNAKAVSVIGTFNSWDSRRNPMRVLGESGIWELFILDLRDMTNINIK